MSEELPHIFVASLKTQKRKVTQIYFLLADHYVHLHRHMFKASDESLSDILQIVIAEYQIDFTIQAIKHLCPFGSTTQTEIAQVEYCVIGSNDIIPVCYHGLIHLLYILERTVAEAYDIRMTKMRIGCKERMFCIKLEIHFCFLLLCASLRG